LQQFKLRVALEQDLDFYQIGIQMTYAFAGHNKEIEYFLPCSFLIDRDVLLGCVFTDIRNERLCVYELLAYMAKAGYRVLLAYDCLVRGLELGAESGHRAGTERAQSGNVGNTEIEEQVLRENSNEFNLEDQLLQMIYDNPGDEKALLRLIGLYFEDKKWDQVDVYVNMMPDNLPAALYGVKSLDKQDLFNEAYDKIKVIDIDGIGDVSLKKDFMLTKAKLLMRSENKEGVLPLLNGVLQYETNNIDAILTRGIYFLSRTELDMAYFDFDKILSIEPSNVRALLGKGLALQAKNKYAESTHCFAKALGIDFENVDAIDGLLKNAYATRDFTLVEKALDDYIEVHPADLDMMFTLAGVSYEMRKNQKARELLDKIMVFRNDYPGAQELLLKIRN
jgi:tetratricopeptide (TPR) repeat protein